MRRPLLLLVLLAVIPLGGCYYYPYGYYYPYRYRPAYYAPPPPPPPVRYYPWPTTRSQRRHRSTRHCAMPAALHAGRVPRPGGVSRVIAQAIGGARERAIQW